MLKRIVDIIASVAGLTLLSPLLLGLALTVRLSSPGPVFYRATRVGRYGKTFKLFKFRSMVVNADQIGPAVTGATDPRITRVGRLLRRTKIDEFPQLINVLLGDMSLVGPRPEDPRYVALYNDEQRKVLSIRPGITSPASIAYRNEEALLLGSNWEDYYIEHIMPAKLVIDLDYARNPNLWQDAQVILKTVRALFS